MKIIMSHDVDHLFWSEHWRDTYFYKFFLRSLFAIGRNGITWRQFLNRFRRNRLTNAIALNRFNSQNGIRSTFFFGMRQGLNLSYFPVQAAAIIKELVDDGASIGLHGMGFDSLQALKAEKERLLEFLPTGYPVGIRNHYLRMNQDTQLIMDELGFLYDSTEYSLNAPYRIGQMWEVPISFMDAGIIMQGRNNMAEIKARTLALLNGARVTNVPFFVINFHDIFFADGFPYHLAWYHWVVKYAKSEGYEFCNFFDAIEKLSNEHAPS